MHTLRGLAIGFAGALAMAAVPAIAAGFPEKPVEVVVAGSAGGGLDLTGRALETALREARLFPENFVIKNVGGAGGNVARAQVNQNKGDDHVLYVESNRIYVNRIVGTLQAAATDPDGTFAGFVAALATRLDAGRPAAEAWQETIAGLAADRVS